jgi:hypothetical protein
MWVMTSPEGRGFAQNSRINDCHEIGLVFTTSATLQAEEKLAKCFDQRQVFPHAG